MSGAVDATAKESLDLQLARPLTPLKAMSDSHLRELLQTAHIEMMFRGQTLFEAGDYDRQYIYLLHGDMELIDSKAQATLQKGRASLLPLAHHQPRAHTAKALTDCSVLRLNSEQVDQMLAWSQIAEYLLLDIAYQRDLDEDVAWINTVLRSNLFFKVPPINVEEIFSCLESVEVRAGEVILRQGELGDCCYFIKEGEAEVSRFEEGASRPVHVADITVGRCFGEDALVNEAVRNATVTMCSDGVLMRLAKQDFIRLLKQPDIEPMSQQHWLQAVAPGVSACLSDPIAGRAEVTRDVLPPWVIIDLRTEEEYATGHLRCAVNIPLNLLRIKTRLLNRQSSYLLYCDTGLRSEAAAHLLNRQGFEAKALDGGLNALEPIHYDSQITLQDYVLRDGVVFQGQ